MPVPPIRVPSPPTVVSTRYDSDDERPAKRRRQGESGDSESQMRSSASQASMGDSAPVGASASVGSKTRANSPVSFNVSTLSISRVMYKDAMRTPNHSPTPLDEVAKLNTKKNTTYNDRKRSREQVDQATFLFQTVSLAPSTSNNIEEAIEKLELIAYAKRSAESDKDH